ncbi:MAG: hypothetical protein JWO50_733 [Candidatus Kaiserbacteria bacterium]|nr:hypothetical protein [Candidatus Kaiserbacteria bacterium]
MGIFSDIALLFKDHTTYDIGLIQAKGYRVFKQVSAEVLKPQGLTNLEWAILGILSHSHTSMRASEVAAALGVQPSLVSRAIISMEKNKWIKVSQGEDRRERVLALTEKGEDGIFRIEKLMKLAMKPLIANVATRDLIGYLRTSAQISENSKDLSLDNEEVD